MNKQIFLLILLMSFNVFGACSLDHLAIGINPDGLIGTPDDKDLFVDCSQKYRHSTQNGLVYKNRYYTMTQSWYGYYSRSEPGLDLIADINRSLDTDESHLLIECVSIAPGLSVLQGTSVIFDVKGDIMDYSLVSDPHIHLMYKTYSITNLQWFSFRVIDQNSFYHPSQIITIVFNTEPSKSDVCVDGSVNSDDFSLIINYWLYGSSLENDYCERTDINSDGIVNLIDIALFANDF